MTETGIVTVVNDEHSENALVPIVVTETGIVTEVNDEHLENT